MRPSWSGAATAESDDTFIVVANRCFPVDSVVPARPAASEATTICPGKGDASCYRLKVGVTESRNAAP